MDSDEELFDESETYFSTLTPSERTAIVDDTNQQTEEKEEEKLYTLREIAESNMRNSTAAEKNNSAERSFYELLAFLAHDAALGVGLSPPTMTLTREERMLGVRFKYS